VVKSLDTHLHAVPGTAGATILGDGRVALILDVNSIVRANAARVRMAA
jgi:two-component system chemotaxis sensor kinase CheA